ncbi:ferrous iron transport protein A [bacterium]|nr:ferrous iron transport protein A [bacterium]
MRMITLDRLIPGQKGSIQSISAPPAILQRLLEMGLLEGEEVEVVALAPFGDPIDLRIHGFQLSIRKSEASTIQVLLAGESS